MDVFYGKRFSKDLDAIRHENKVKKNLLELIRNIKEIDSLKTLGGVKKIEGYSDYFRVKLGDYRLGLRASQNKVELIRFLHRKEIYRRFP
jgi:mRNA interferase RelE/StbE